MKQLNQQQISAICDVIAETNKGLSKSVLEKILSQNNITILDDGKRQNNFGYVIGQNKRTWLYNCIVEDINKNHDFNKIFTFIESVVNPVMYTTESNREKFNYLVEEINKILLLDGLMINKSGKIIIQNKANSLDEVDIRVNKMKQQLYNRHIHSEVQKYCIKDLLRNDYYDAVFEASKGLAERVRTISGLKDDGIKLFNTAFSTNDPYLFFNKLETDSEKNEYNGLKELLCSIFHLVRNPAAHTPKINWKMDENKALDILTLISFGHYYLDSCNKIPNK